MWIFAAKRKRATTLGFSVGTKGIAECDFNPKGYVLLNGELWPAFTDYDIFCGDLICIVGSKDVLLKVKPLSL